jgi:hypothetical protein
MKSTRKKTDFKVVVIDESRDWKEDILKRAGGKIETVYLYDANIETCCCEATPSYYLIPLYAVSALSGDELSDDVDMEIRNAQALCNDPIYVHCKDVEKMKKGTYAHARNGTFYAHQGRKYRELEEQAIEYLNGNTPY